MDQSMESFVTGLSQSLNSYLGKKQELANAKELKAAPGPDDGTQEPLVTPEMAEKMGPGLGSIVTSYNQKNPTNPLKLKDAIAWGKQVGANAAEMAPDPPSPKYYMGNNPDGDAIFSDKTGTMFDPNGNVYKGKVLPKSSNMATSSTRSSSEFATTLLPHIQDMREMINEADAKGYIGPTAGRIYGQFLAGKIGSTGDVEADNLLGKLRATDSLIKTGAMRVHFGARGGSNMYDHFSELLNSGKQSKAMLNGSLDTLESFMQGYANAGQPAGKSSPKVNNNDPLGIR